MRGMTRILHGPTGGEPLWFAPKKARDIPSRAEKVKQGVKQAAPGNYRTRCFVHRSLGDSSSAQRAYTPNTRVETFPGAACLTPYWPSSHLNEYRGFLGTFQSGSPPFERGGLPRAMIYYRFSVDFSLYVRPPHPRRLPHRHSLSRGS
jgi:hypothetical protein